MRISNFASPSLVHSLLLPLSLSLSLARSSQFLLFLSLFAFLPYGFIFSFFGSFSPLAAFKVVRTLTFSLYLFFFFLGNREKSLLYFVVLFLVRKCACSSLSTFLGCFRIVSCFFFFCYPKHRKVHEFSLGYLQVEYIYVYTS